MEPLASRSVTTAITTSPSRVTTVQKGPEGTTPLLVTRTIKCTNSPGSTGSSGNPSTVTAMSGRGSPWPMRRATNSDQPPNTSSTAPSWSTSAAATAVTGEPMGCIGAISGASVKPRRMWIPPLTLTATTSAIPSPSRSRTSRRVAASSKIPSATVSPDHVSITCSAPVLSAATTRGSSGYPATAVISACTGKWTTRSGSAGSTVAKPPVRGMTSSRVPFTIVTVERLTDTDGGNRWLHIASEARSVRCTVQSSSAKAK